jgi:hypothetical protein
MDKEIANDLAALGPGSGAVGSRLRPWSVRAVPARDGSWARSPSRMRYGGSSERSA